MEPGEGSAAPKATVALPGTDVKLAGRAPARLAVHCSLATGGPGAATRHAPFGRPRRPLGTFPRGESTSSARRRAKPPTGNRFLVTGKGKSFTFFFLFRRGFRLCGGDQGAFRSPPGPLRGPSLYAWVKSSTRNNFLAEGRKRACPNPSHKCKQPRWIFPPPWPYCIYYIFSRTTFTSSCPARTGISWVVSNSYPSGTCSTYIT